MAIDTSQPNTKSQIGAGILNTQQIDTSVPNTKNQTGAGILNTMANGVINPATGMLEYKPMPITPESLTPVTPAPYAQPSPTLVPPVPEPIPDQTLTPQETTDQATTDRLTQISDQLVGKSGAQTSANEEYGVNAVQKTITDLNARLVGLKNQELAIPLLLEKSPTTAGITTDIFNAQKGKLLRDNAIEALTVSSLMAAASGQLSNAQSLADKAVSAKYGPLEAEYEAKSRNLLLIRNSPQYSLEEKNRAAKQQAIIDANKEKQDKQKQDTQNIQKVALDAAANGADSQTLDAISKAKTPIEAIQIAARFAKQQGNAQAMANVPTKFANANGEFMDKTGKAFKTPQEFFAAAGVSSFEEAYKKGLVTDIKPAVDLKAYPASYQEYLLAKQEGYTGSYMQYQTEDANRKAVRNTTVNNTTLVDDKRTYDLQVAQAPSQVATLKSQGKSWQQIADYFNKLGIDPGQKEIDDALHRAFQSQKDYQKWKENQ